jgi:hypothetical protein
MFGVSSPQIAAAAKPLSRIQDLVDGTSSEAESGESFVGRPYSVWRERPELAFEINEALSRSRDDKIISPRGLC